MSTSVHEPATYEPGNHKRSYIRDLVRTACNLEPTGENLRNLRHHAQDVERRDLSRIDGQGGYAVPRPRV